MARNQGNQIGVRFRENQRIAIEKRVIESPEFTTLADYIRSVVLDDLLKHGLLETVGGSFRVHNALSSRATFKRHVLEESA